MAFIFLFELYHWLRVEKSSNWHDLSTAFDQRLSWAPIPNRHINDWNGVTSNSYGFRSDEPEAEASSIAMVGDSIVWGFGVADEATCTAFLQARVVILRYQVHNLGVSGYGLRRYYLYLKRHIARLPGLEQVVLVILASGDLADSGSNSRFGKRKPLYRMWEGRLQLTNSLVSKYCMRNLASKSEFLRRLGLGGHRTAAVLGDRTLDDGEVEQVAALLVDRIDDLVRAHGADLTIVLSPEASELKPERESQGLGWFRDLVRSRGYRHVDHARNLQTGRLKVHELYVDPWHYTKLGNDLLAASVFESLSGRLKQ